MSRAAVILAIILAFSAMAGEPPAPSITPSSGPAAGGTEVTITGDFASSLPQEVMFGDVAAVSTRKVNSHTLVVVTPAHLPGASEIVIFEYDAFLSTDLKFTFTGPVPEEDFARILIPVHVPDVHGAFGSVFRTELYATAKRGEPGVYGLLKECPFLCVPVGEPWDFAEAYLRSDTTYHEPNGTPGRFVYVQKEQVDDVSMSLRAYDVSRSGINYGTSIPVVRFDEAADTVVVFPIVPADDRFRNTLRIYSDVPARVTITGGDGGGELLHESLQLAPGANIFEPAFATFTDFPAASSLRVAIASEENARIWALLTVTNNDTQAITAITPQP